MHVEETLIQNVRHKPKSHLVLNKIIRSKHHCRRPDLCAVLTRHKSTEYASMNWYTQNNVKSCKTCINVKDKLDMQV